MLNLGRSRSLSQLLRGVKKKTDSDTNQGIDGDSVVISSPVGSVENSLNGFPSPEHETAAPSQHDLTAKSNRYNSSPTSPPNLLGASHDTSTVSPISTSDESRFTVIPNSSPTILPPLIP